MNKDGWNARKKMDKDKTKQRGEKKHDSSKQ